MRRIERPARRWSGCRRLSVWTQSRAPRPRTGAAERPPPIEASQLDHPHFDFFRIVDAKPELRGILDVAGLPNEGVVLGIAVIAEELARPLPQRCRAFGFALRLDDVENLAIHRDRV